MGFNHFDENGNAVMVDVSEKAVTSRTATAKGTIVVSPEVMKAIHEGTAKKGDVLGVARVAGIMAVKKTPEFIPMAHPLPVTKASVDFELDDERHAITAFCTVKTDGKTGVEMEALTGVHVTLLTIYDMCKAMDKRMRMENIHLCEKSGGKSGDIAYGPQQPVISVCGIKNSGKTTVLEKLIPELISRGLKVAVFKNGGHFTPDMPGTDTYRFLQVGASGTLFFDDQQYQISRKLLPPYEELFIQFPEADLLLVEGLRGTELPKLEIIKPNDERSPALSEDKVLGYIAENGAYTSSKPVFDRDDVKGIADFIMELYESGALEGAVL